MLVKLIYSSLANAEKAGFFKTSLPVLRQIDRQINNTGKNTDRQDKKKEHRLRVCSDEGLRHERKTDRQTERIHNTQYEHNHSCSNYAHIRALSD